MVFDFKFPDVGEGITEGEIVKWKVKEGDLIKQDQDLADVETDKAIVQIPSPASGRILKLHAKEGDLIKVGDVIVTIDDGKTPVPKEERKSTGVVGELPEASETLPSPPKPNIQQAQAKRVLATPAIRKMAQDLGINVEAVNGTGPEGRITEQDLKVTVEVESSKPKIQKKYDMYGYIERIPMKGVRRATANRLVKSISSIPHVTHMDEADVTDLWSHREKEKKKLTKRGVHITFMPFIMKACIAALKEHPEFNSSLEDDTGELILKKYYNIGFAADTEDGLMVPVVKVADKKSVLDLAKEMEELSKKARDRKIDLGDMKGGTFTITNIGALGGIFATPIINYPESAILAVGQIRDVPKVVKKKIVIRKMMPLSLSFDHRITDGANAARFVNSIKEHLEDPDELLMEG